MAQDTIARTVYTPVEQNLVITYRRASDFAVGVAAAVETFGAETFVTADGGKGYVLATPTGFIVGLSS